MQLAVLVLLVLAALAVLLWTWRTGRRGGDPVSSVDSFHRALTAMSPGQQSRDETADDGDIPDPS